MSKRSVDETKLLSPFSGKASKPEAAATKKKRSKVDGDERPAPPEATFAFVKPKDQPTFDAPKVDHVTNMRFSIQNLWVPSTNVGLHSTKTDYKSIKFSSLNGVGPVKVPIEDTPMTKVMNAQDCYYYTGPTAPHHARGPDECCDFNLDIASLPELYGSHRGGVTKVYRSPAVPNGNGEITCKNWWAKGTFEQGVANGFCAYGNRDNGKQFCGTFRNGLLHGKMEEYSNNGSLVGTCTYESGKLDGPANLYMCSPPIHGIGCYRKDRMQGMWQMTEADGKHYTTWYNDGCEDMNKRTATVYLKPLPPPPELDANGNTKIYTVDETVQLAKEEEKTLTSAPPKSQTPREQAFVNTLSHELQEAGVIVTHEHKAGPGREALDLKFSRAKFGVLCAVKVYGTELSQNSGDLSHYRHWLRKNDPEIGRMAKEDKLIAVNVLVTEPKQENVEAAEDDMNQFVWTPSKGKFLDYIDEIIADKQKPAVAA